MAEKIETREVAVVKQQATKAVSAANDLVIKTAEDMQSATDILGKIKQVAKMAKARKEAITKPLNEALASARDLFKPIEANCAEAEGVIKGKMVAYQTAADKAAEVERARIAARVDRGTMTDKTAMKKMGEIEQAPAAVQGKTAAMAFRNVKKVRFATVGSLLTNQVLDLATAGYLVWDETAARRDALAGKVIPGVEVYEEKVVASSSHLDADHPFLGQK